MKKQEVSRKSGVDKIFNIKIEDGYFLHSDYSISEETEHEISDTGLMKVFELNSSKPEKPKFVGRWDEKANLLGIDIYFDIRSLLYF
ncbi:MAG TPA: hypothetical protein VIR98_03190 [Candidatus Paceibacterota bacterium]|jgi:hypothetical protein